MKKILSSLSTCLGLCLILFVCTQIWSEDAKRILPDPYYPQQPTGNLRLNYYYDRSGTWVKFSDWIPFQKYKYVPKHLEDFYELYGLPNAYTEHHIKRNIYYLYEAMSHKFRHPSRSLCKIENEDEFHKYRLLFFMHINQLIMRSFMRLASQYDVVYLLDHDMDFADELETSFLIARSYYMQALPFWDEAVKYAQEASQYSFTLDLGGIESERYAIVRNELDYKRQIERHLNRLEEKLSVIKSFLDKEGRPKPVKKTIDKNFNPF